MERSAPSNGLTYGVISNDSKTHTARVGHIIIRDASAQSSIIRTQKSPIPYIITTGQPDLDVSIRIRAGCNTQNDSQDVDFGSSTGCTRRLATLDVKSRTSDMIGAGDDGRVNIVESKRRSKTGTGLSCCRETGQGRSPNE